MRTFFRENLLFVVNTGLLILLIAGASHLQNEAAETKAESIVTQNTKKVTADNQWATASTSVSVPAVSPTPVRLHYEREDDDN